MGELRVLTLVRSDPSSALIVLDIDGTLAPIVDRPEDASAVAGAADTLRHLVASGVRVALLSGRPAAEGAAIAGLADTDEVQVLGHYGMQRWRAGALQSPAVAPGVTEARRRLPAVLADADAPAGVVVEDKQHSLVVHTRRTADPSGVLRLLEPRLRELADSAGLELLPGRAVLELRPPGVDKGGALRGLADEVGASVVVYVGDDVADLEAFAALRELGASGTVTLAVAAVDPTLDDTDPRVAAAADVVLAGPESVVEWLRRIVPRA